MTERLAAPRSFEAIRQEAIGWQVDHYGADHPRRSSLFAAIDAISLAALHHAEAIGATDDAFEVDILRPGIQAVQTLQWAVQWLRKDISEPDKVKLWHHREDLFEMVKANKAPRLDREQIEQATGMYLALPYRAQGIDRLFADVLVFLETSAFCDQMWNERVIPEFGEPASPLKKTHPFRPYLKGMAKNIAWTVGVIVAMFAGYAYGWIGGAWAAGLALAWTALTSLSFVLMTATLPGRWKKHNADKAKILGLMQEMLDVYGELKSDGPVSARRLLERLKDADAKGAVWPAPLYALLDDVMTGTGRL